MSIDFNTLLARSSSFRARRRRVVRRLKDPSMRSWTWSGTEVSDDFIEQSKEVFIGASDVTDYITSTMLIERHKRCIETDHQEITVLVSYADWMTYCDSTGLRSVRITKDRGFLINDEELSYIHYDINSSTTVVKLFGDNTFVSKWWTELNEKFERVDNVIEWIYNADGQSIEVPLRPDRVPVSEMYPWLGDQSLEQYYDDFLHSDASILLLIGPPGTGKTTFIRGFLQHTKQSAIVTYDASILAKDYVFAQFIENDISVMVIEDADNFLRARTDGNDIMHKFLNVGDGLVTTKNKKMIFSTNLPSIRDIDSALIRPGRCFDIVNFDMLDSKQATKLANKLGVVFDVNDQGKYSIADVFFKQIQKTKAPKRSMGFV